MSCSLFCPLVANANSQCTVTYAASNCECTLFATLQRKTYSSDNLG